MGFYDDRKLHSVSIGLIRPTKDEHGPIVSIIAHINVNSREDGEIPGPGIDVEVAIPASEDASLRDIKDRGLELAFDLVQRISRVTLSELRDAASKPPEFDLTKK